MPRSRLRFTVAIVAALVMFACDPATLEPPSLAVALAPALAAKERHVERLLAISDVVGAGVGYGADGRPAVKVFTRTAGVRGLPHDLDGVPVVAQAIGELHALPIRGTSSAALAIDNTAKFPLPVPIGISTGNQGKCSAGTISARVRDAAGRLYALSNNHVFALENDARLGSPILQPGLFDTGCALAGTNALGALFDFQRIAFRRKANNTMDAAIATVTSGTLGAATPADGYGLPNHITAAAFVTQPVQKYGRTTALTHGRVTAIGATMLIGYVTGTARFVNQVVVESGTKFIGPGDSGSLLVTDDAAAYPVGLLFAGNGPGTMAIANPIGPVLARFGVTVDGK